MACGRQRGSRILRHRRHGWRQRRERYRERHRGCHRILGELRRGIGNGGDRRDDGYGGKPAGSGGTAGTAGAAGAAGATGTAGATNAPPSACPKDCAKDGKRCNAATKECVTCLDSGDCDASEGVCDPPAGMCSACNLDGECKGSGFGSVCVSDWRCGCKADLDCAGARAGSRCDTYGQQCSCATDGDCQPGASCELVIPGLGVCRTKCHADDDCNGPFALSFANAEHHRCDVPSGACVACTTNAHCAAGLCNPTLHLCVQCLTAADCAGSPAGPVCIGAGSCGCALDAECGGGKVCEILYVGSPGTCETPCAGPSACGYAFAPICAADGHCRACKGNAECAAGKVCAVGGACLECETDAHCTGHPGGAHCQFDHTCGCTASADCTGSAAGPTCLNTKGSAACGCAATAECAPGKTCAPTPMTPFASCP